MSRRLEDLHPLLVGVWKAALEVWKIKHPDGPEVIITYTNRSNEEQNRLYAQGRTTKGPIVTRAKAGQSPHNYLPSYAFDIAFKEGNKLNWDIKFFNEFAAIVRQQPNGEKVLWGDAFGDKPHFELRGWKNMVSAKVNEPVSYELKHPMMTGEKVKEIQRKLGLKLIDGVFGTVTHLAVKQFQLQHKLLVDGKVGPMTAKKMGITL